MGDISTFLDNKRIPLKEDDRKQIKGEYPYYGASGIIDYVNDYIFDEELILMGEDGANIVTRSSKLIFLAKGKYWVNNHAHVIKADNNINQYFLSESLERINYEKYNTGTAQPKLNREVCQKIKVKIPQFNEQNKIANFLLVIDEKLRLLEQKYQYYQNFKKYLMQQIFTQKLRFDDNCQYKTKQVKDFLIESKIEGIDDINKRLTVKLNLKGITVRESKTIEIEGATKQFIRKTGQFIYGKQNLHKGAFGIIPKELDGYLTSSDIPSFDFKGGIEPKWFYYYFARKSFYEKLENLSTGTGSKRISPKEFLNIKIIVPEFKEQHKIVCLLEKFDEKINGISNQIVQMNMFKKSLLQQMFVVRINWRCNFKLAKSPSFNKHLLILKNKIIFIIIK
ncbi:restriction endonuclease subunit S [Methanobrevibacter smithii]|uniref:restriction endonuclease subunit S n=1 Tax=Methanobrevibacter smithii TaxID=2173 RepID=UPI0037DD649B